MEEMKEKVKQLIYEGSSFDSNYHVYELTETDINILAEEIVKLFDRHYSKTCEKS